METQTVRGGCFADLFSKARDAEVPARPETLCPETLRTETQRPGTLLRRKGLPSCGLKSSAALKPGAVLPSAELVGGLKAGLEKLVAALEALTEKLKMLLERSGGTPSSSPPTAPAPTVKPPVSTPPATTPPAATPPVTATPPTPAPSVSAFAQKVRELVTPDAKGQVTEAQLDFAISAYQVFQKSPALLEEFKSHFNTARSQGSYIDTSVRKALNELANSGKLTKEEAERYIKISFRASQLDENFEQLAGRNGGTNLRSGKADLAAAVAKAESTFIGIGQGTISLPS